MAGSQGSNMFDPVAFQILCWLNWSCLVLIFENVPIERVDSQLKKQTWIQCVAQMSNQNASSLNCLWNCEPWDAGVSRGDGDAYTGTNRAFARNRLPRHWNAPDCAVQGLLDHHRGRDWRRQMAWSVVLCLEDVLGSCTWLTGYMDILDLCPEKEGTSWCMTSIHCAIDNLCADIKHDLWRPWDR